MLYFHGNAGSLRNRADRFRALAGDGYGLVALSYRGYGGSTGSPSEAGLIADAQAAYAFAAARVPAQRIVVFGESLGTGVAVALAATQRIGGLVLQAPFTSAVDVGARVYWFLPVRLLMKDPFRSDARIGKVTVPLLVLHGERDQVVPIALGERLFALANEPKRFVRFPDGASRRSRPIWRAGRGAVVHRPSPALNSPDALASPVRSPKLAFAPPLGCARGIGGGAGMSMRADLGIRRDQERRCFADGSRPSRRRRRCSR